MIFLNITWDVLVISEALNATGGCDLKYLFKYYSNYSGEQ